MTLHTVLDKEAIAEALRAASLEDICTELLRKAQVCDAMGNDCGRFADHEEDPERRATHENAAVAFYRKARIYRDMVYLAKGLGVLS